MNIAIIGARGCVGSALIKKLIDTTEYTVIASYRREEKTDIEHPRVIWKRVNLFDDLGTEEFLEGADVAIYLVHSLASKKFKTMDRSFAERTGKFAAKAGVKKIIYLGGIIPHQERLSAHLRSRKETGEQLAKYGVPVAEVRASIILGTCSASYRMIYWLSKRLPVLVMPKWGMANCSPIALNDVTDMLAALVDREVRGHELFEIGAERMGYDELLMRNGAIINGKRNTVVHSMLFPIAFAAWWVHIITGVPRRIAAVLMESLKNDSSVTHDRFREIVGRDPQPVDKTLSTLVREMRSMV